MGRPRRDSVPGRLLGSRGRLQFHRHDRHQELLINPDCHACPKEYTGELPEGYTLGTRNPVWLPFESSGTTAGGRSPGTSNVVVETGAGSTETIAETILQDRVNWIEGPTSSLRSTEYNFCIVSALGFYRAERDHEAYFGQPREIPVFEANLSSGMTKGTVILAKYGVRERVSWAEYMDYSILGPDGHLFVLPTLTTMTSRRTGTTSTTRSLGLSLRGATHIITKRTPTGINPAISNRPTAIWFSNVTVEAPEGTVHEAFFDPATTTAGVGYLATTSTTTGVLEPAGFSVRGRAIAITGLTWQNGRVVLTLDRFGSWLDGFSFIEPNGTVGLRLAEVDATKDWTARTLTWEVSEQPWESGDELMLRMEPIPLPAVGNLTAEANSAGRWY